MFRKFLTVFLCCVLLSSYALADVSSPSTSVVTLEEAEAIIAQFNAAVDRINEQERQEMLLASRRNRQLAREYLEPRTDTATKIISKAGSSITELNSTLSLRNYAKVNYYTSINRFQGCSNAWTEVVGYAVGCSFTISTRDYTAEVIDSGRVLAATILSNLTMTIETPVTPVTVSRMVQEYVEFGHSLL